MHQNGLLLFKKYLQQEFIPGSKVLEIAPIKYPSVYYELVNDPSLDWHGLDVRTQFIEGHNNNPKFVLSKDEFHYPFADNTFDIVFSDQVFAHVRYPWEWYKELKRIVKPGGRVITIATMSWPESPSPIDCWRVYPDGMRNINEYVGLETQLSVCDSGEYEYYNIPRALEKVPNAVHFYTGFGFNPAALKANRIKLFMVRWMRHIPGFRALMNPISVAYDTVTIARKPVV